MRVTNQRSRDRVRKAVRNGNGMLNHVREDIDDLQDNVTGAVEGLQNRGIDAMESIGEHIRDKPGQSLAIAFVAGALSSLILGSARH
jgi:ElaB/YqjD/DUF883 family membrane-anchored ribosome-binding protein